MCSATLVFEAIVVLLAIAPTLVLTDASTGWVVGGYLGVAVLGVLVAGSLRRPGGYAAGFVVQALVVATGLALTAMFAVGAVFAALWVTSYLLGRRIEADKARWAQQAAAAAGPESADR